jgi:hypothetical protein
MSTCGIQMEAAEGRGGDDYSHLVRSAASNGQPGRNNSSSPGRLSRRSRARRPPPRAGDETCPPATIPGRRRRPRGFQRPRSPHAPAVRALGRRLRGAAGVAGREHREIRFEPPRRVPDCGRTVPHRKAASSRPTGQPATRSSRTRGARLPEALRSRLAGGRGQRRQDGEDQPRWAAKGAGSAGGVRGARAPAAAATSEAAWAAA